MIAPRTTAGMDDGIMIVQTTLPGQMNEADLGQWCQVFIELNQAACINNTKVRSIFSWEKQVASEYEWKIQIKTTIKAKDSLVSKIKSDHPYDLPEITWWHAEAVAGYLEWVNKI